MNRITRNASIYYVGSMIVAAVGFFNTIMLTRVLSQHLYAVYGIFTALTTSLVMALSLGFDSSYMRFYYSSGYSKKKFLFKSLVCPLVFYMIFSVIVFGFGHKLISDILGESLSFFGVVLFLSYILFVLIRRFTQVTARMEERPFNFVSSNFVERCGFVLLIFVIVISGYTVKFDHILLSFVLCAMLSLTMNLIILRMPQKTIIEAGCISQAELFRFGFPICLFTSLVSIVPVIERVIIRSIIGWEILSIYTAAVVFQSIVRVLSSTMDNIWNPIVFQKYRNESVLKPIMHNVGLTITVFLIVCLSAVIMLRRWIIIIFASEYRDAMILSPSVFYVACVSMIASIYGVGISISKKTIHYVLSIVIQLLIFVALSYIIFPVCELRGVGIVALLSVLAGSVYRIIVGMKYYDTGCNETKMYCLIALGAFASFFTLFNTEFVSDCVICIMTILLAILIVNVEFVPILKWFRSYSHQSCAE